MENQINMEQENIPPKEFLPENEEMRQPEPARYEEPKQPEPIVERHSKEYPVKNEKEYDSKNNKKSVLIPTERYETLMKLLDFINEMSADEFKTSYSKQQASVTGINIESIGTGTKDDVFYDNINSQEYFNNVEYGESNLNMKAMKIKASGKMSGNAAVAKFSSAMGIGETVNIPLWHTGIWMTIKPPKDTDLINLEIALANNQIKLGRETNTLVFSNYSVVFTRIVVDFIVQHIVSYSVELPEDKDIRDLIRIQDLPTMIIGLIATMYPNGYPIIRNCKNSLKLEDKVPVCDFSVSGDVDPIKLLWVNKKVLTKNNLLHMSNKRPSSVKYEEVIEYQKSLLVLQPLNVNIETESGNNVTMEITSPTLGDYIDNGENWIETIKVKAEELFTDGDSEEIKNSKVRDTLNAVVLGVYNIYVSKLKLEDGTEVDDRGTINEIIDLLSSDETILKTYIDKIRNFISDKTITVIATPTFTCPKCKEAGRDAEQDVYKDGPFKNFLPINVLEHFFDLGALKTSQIKNRDIS